MGPIVFSEVIYIINTKVAILINRPARVVFRVHLQNSESDLRRVANA